MSVRRFGWLLLALTGTCLAQDRLPHHPRYERWQRMRGEIAGSVRRGTVAGTWTASGKLFVFTRDGERVAFDTANGKITPFTGETPGRPSPPANPNSRRRRPERGRQFTETFSNDGKKRAFYRDGNVWTSDADGKNETQLTTQGDAAKRIKFGSASWVYGEELNQNEAMGWSPDGTKLWQYRFDDSMVKDYYLAMNVTKLQTTLDAEPYPKAGTPNPTVDLYVYDFPTKSLNKIDVREGRNFDEEVGHYVYSIRFSSDGRELWYHRTNRRQNIVEFCAADPITGKTRVIVRESNPNGWVDNHPAMWLLDSDENISKAPKYKGKMILQTEKNGYYNFDLVDIATGERKEITKHPFEVAGILRIDLEKGQLFYRARSGPNPYHLQFHSCKLDGTGDQRHTDPSLSHDINLSPDNLHFIDISQDADSPPSSEVRKLGGASVGHLAQSDISKFTSLNLQKVEHFTFIAADGKTTCYGFLSKPSDFDPSRKYPVFVDVYGGPESGTDVASFRTPDPDTELGILKVWIDGRITGGRGRAFKDSGYQKLGQTEIDDQAAAIMELRKRPYVDGSKVCIQGTSYGGYSSAMAIVRYPDVFQAACASSPVTDWKNYDTIYTERYMWTPQGNAEGYEKGSAMTYVNQLKGRLMLFYGTADNNVHPANTYMLVQALMRAGKSYDLQVGPDWGHSGIPEARMYEFFFDALGLWGK